MTLTSNKINWNAIIIAAIAAIPPTVAAIAAYFEATRAIEQGAATQHSVDGRMTDLLVITKKAATDAATIAEKLAEQERKGAAAIATIQANPQLNAPVKIGK